MGTADLKRGAIVAGAVIGSGAVIGGGAGAVRSLKAEANPETQGFTAQEQRSTLANVLLGAGGGTLAGFAVHSLQIKPLRGMSTLAMLGLGFGTGAATAGAYALGRNVAN